MFDPRFRFWSCALLAAMAVIPRGSAADLPADQIDQIVKSAGVTADTPGVAVAVVSKGKIIFQKGYGLARLTDRAAFTPRTTCEIASMTKMFTAVAVMILHDRGKLALGDDVRKYIPELPEYYPGTPATITHLLQHTSGLPAYLEFPEPKGSHAGYVTCADYAREFARLRQKHPAAFEPGEKHVYNNTNYMLLALVIERVTKLSYGQFLKAEVLEPLGMKESWVYESPVAAPKVAAKSAPNAIGYRKEKGKWQEGWGAPPFRSESLLTVGDGGLWTNLDDLVRWDAGLRAGKLIKPETLKLALAPSKTRDGKSNDYGFGFGLTLRGGKLEGYWHNGAWVFRAMYYRDVKNDHSIIILSNRDGFPVEATSDKIRAILQKGD